MTYKLTAEQRRLIDATILQAITEIVRNGYVVPTAHAISAYTERRIAKDLPARAQDFYRYVDAGLQRLRKANTIKHQRDPSNNNFVIWVKT